MGLLKHLSTKLHQNRSNIVAKEQKKIENKSLIEFKFLKSQKKSAKSMLSLRLFH